MQHAGPNGHCVWSSPASADDDRDETTGEGHARGAIVVIAKVNDGLDCYRR